ncbi:MAG: hypothetical protein KF878_25120 [Planctomycetes bacterium]|nr:hypothetical protein [Planctomycetota bacterium]
MFYPLDREAIEPWATLTDTFSVAERLACCGQWRERQVADLRVEVPDIGELVHGPGVVPTDAHYLLVLHELRAVLAAADPRVQFREAWVNGDSTVATQVVAPATLQARFGSEGGDRPSVACPVCGRLSGGASLELARFHLLSSTGLAPLQVIWGAEDSGDYFLSPCLAERIRLAGFPAIIGKQLPIYDKPFTELMDGKEVLLPGLSCLRDGVFRSALRPFELLQVLVQAARQRDGDVAAQCFEALKRTDCPTSLKGEGLRLLKSATAPASD